MRRIRTIALCVSILATTSVAAGCSFTSSGDTFFKEYVRSGQLKETFDDLEHVITRTLANYADSKRGRVVIKWEEGGRIVDRQVLVASSPVILPFDRWPDPHDPEVASVFERRTVVPLGATVNVPKPYGDVWVYGHVQTRATREGAEYKWFRVPTEHKAHVTVTFTALERQ